MNSLTDFALKEEYKHLEVLGDKLSEIDTLIDWKPFRPVISGMYNNKTQAGGRPNNDEIVMLKMLVLQQWHGLSDPDHAKADTPRGKDAKTRRIKDRTWTKKGSTSHFGYKLHTIMDTEYQLIRRIETTTASLHDSQVDLSSKDEVVYRDQGYFGAKERI